MELKLIFIGGRFYRESGTAMSSIYTEDGERSDWGNVQVSLEEGSTVTIRPATAGELGHYKAKLEKLLGFSKV